MSKYTNEELFERYQSLPKDVQDAILSIDTSEIIREIGENHKLMIDKIGELADETGLVMLGLTHPNQFIIHLTERLEVEHDIAKEIAEDINSRVFFPIRENLKKIHGVEKEIPKESLLGPLPSAQQEQTLGVKEFQTPSVETSPPLPPPLQPTPDVGSVETPEEPKPEPEITTPPAIMSIPTDLTKAEKKVDPYREPTS